MTDREFAKELRAFRAERKRLESEVAPLEADTTYEVSIGSMTRDDVLNLLLEADGPHPPG